jgi:anti-sigma B factor antagonist
MSGDGQLRIVTQQRADRLIVELHGELDMVSSPQLGEAFAELDPGARDPIVLDLHNVSFLDSTGLKAIFAARNVASERGQQFAVTHGSPQVQRLLSLTRLGEHLTMIETADAVLA